MGLQSSVFTLLIVFLLTTVGFASRSFAQPPAELTNSIGMKLMRISKGTFRMGSEPNGKGAEADETARAVTLTTDFYLGVFEVTQAQYEQVMGVNPSYFQDAVLSERNRGNDLAPVPGESLNHPVDKVTWEAAVEFCKRLSELPAEKAAGRVYRLPTEAEWEFACRAGSTTAFSYGESESELAGYGWFVDNSEKKTHPVGQKKPNPRGLYDMHGNVSEWCSDWYGEYPKDGANDPQGPGVGSLRVHRGGNWSFKATGCRSSDRYGLFPTAGLVISGFRVALNAPDTAVSP